MGCDCGKPKCDGHCGVSPAVLQINNPSECVFFHRVEVPASMGDSKTNPPKTGAYKNTLLYYIADGEAYFYSSDGIPTRLTDAAAFRELKEYVDTYFDNLDVQEEINNKLDQMTEDGTLQEIIAAYIQANVAWTFDTVADMKLATNLIAGSYAQTLGFYSIGDGGGALYQISDTGTANEMDVIAIDTLYANLVVPTVLAPEQVGCYGDGSNDDTTAFSRACTLSSKIEGKGIYKLDELSFNNVNIKANIYLIGSAGVTFGNNVTYEGHFENANVTTLANSGRCIYVTGNNNTIRNSKFDGLFKGAGIVIGNSATNTKVEKCTFEPCFKEDVHVAGHNTIIEKCLFAEHGAETVSPITDYDNAIKVSQYLDLSGSNGNNLIIRNNTIYEHGDNPIDCYTGCTNVLIDGNYIYSPSHEALEIKVGNVNEDNNNYAIVNNTIIASHCIKMGRGTDVNGRIDNFRIADNYLETTSGSCVYITSVFNSVITGCNFIGRNKTNITAINMSSPEGETNPLRLIVSNCTFDTFQSVIPEACVNYDAKFDNIRVTNVGRFARVNADVKIWINNSSITCDSYTFNNVAGKVIVNNSELTNQITFVCRTSGFMAIVSNSILTSSSQVFNITSITGKIGISCCDYSGSASLCNKTLTPNVSLTDFS